MAVVGTVTTIRVGARPPQAPVERSEPERSLTNLLEATASVLARIAGEITDFPLPSIPPRRPAFAPRRIPVDRTTGAAAIGTRPVRRIA